MVSMSPLFFEILYGTYAFNLTSTYKIGAQSNQRDTPYFLADGIYPIWPIFLKPIHAPQLDSEIKFSLHQKALRKAFQRYFGVLPAIFRMLKQEIFYWNVDDIVAISNC